MRYHKRSKKPLALIVIIPLVIALMLFALASRGATIEPPVISGDAIDISNLSLMLPILNTENPDADLAIIKKYLKAGDILVDGLNAQNKLIAVKSQIPGVQVGIGGTSIENVPTIAERAAAGVDYITYDYEPDFTAEWVEDQAQSVAYFDDMRAASGEKKFIIVPVYTHHRSWDWGEVAQHADILVLQVQNFQEGARVPPQYTPLFLGENLEQVVSKVVAQVEAKSPSTEVYLQFDSLVTEDPNNILNDIEKVKGLGIDGLTLWYNPQTGGSTSKLGALELVLDNLKR